MKKCGKKLLLAVFMWMMVCSFAPSAIQTVMNPVQVQAAAVKKRGWVRKGMTFYYFVKGERVRGWQEIGGNKYFFWPGGDHKYQMATGWVKIKGEKYYFEKTGKNIGQMHTGWLIEGKNVFYFKRNGALDPYRSALGTRSSDKYGSAHEKTKRRAMAIVDSITTPEMSKFEKLKACFDRTLKYRSTGNPRPNYRGIDWPCVYANDMFLDGGGTCYSFAAAFAYLAWACGYKEAYACNDSGHGWTEVDGLIYDPEEYRNTSHKYFATPYSRVPGYKRGISAYKTYKYMHVRIE